MRGRSGGRRPGPGPGPGRRRRPRRGGCRSAVTAVVAEQVAGGRADVPQVRRREVGQQAGYRARVGEPDPTVGGEQRDVGLPGAAHRADLRRRVPAVEDGQIAAEAALDADHIDQVGRVQAAPAASARILRCRSSRPARALRSRSRSAGWDGQVTAPHGHCCHSPSPSICPAQSRRRGQPSLPPSLSAGSSAHSYQHHSFPARSRLSALVLAPSAAAQAAASD